MIEITFDWKRHELTAKGHANYAPEGQDIVCAAVSILVLTAAERLMDMHKTNRRIYKKPIVVTEKGFARLKAESTFIGNTRINEVFSVICCGLRHMAEEYPENVSYREIF